MPNAVLRTLFGGEAEYPSRPIIKRMKFRRAVKETMRTFKFEKRPWRGTVEERKEKFLWLFEQLNEVYIDRLNGNNPVTVEFVGALNSESSNGSYNRSRHHICLTGKLSVITALHEFAHAMGRDEYGAVKWSVNLYRIYFPLLYASMENDRHMVRPPRSNR